MIKKIMISVIIVCMMFLSVNVNNVYAAPHMVEEHLYGGDGGYPSTEGAVHGAVAGAVAGAAAGTVAGAAAGTVAGAAAGAGSIKANFPSESGSIGTVETAVGATWDTAAAIVQVISVAAVVVAGLKYMFAAADKRADIKKGLGFLVIGAILVFAASTVARFIVTAGDQII